MELPPAQWRKVLATNLDGVFYCAQFAAAHMVERGGGTILVTASTNGLDGHSFYADYNASKAATILLMKTMAVELALLVRVNAVCPGYVLTPMQLAEYSPAMLDAINQTLPLKRHAKPEEVAALFAFLASSEADYITGQAICIDGGETAQAASDAESLRGEVDDDYQSTSVLWNVVGEASRVLSGATRW